MSSSKVSPMMMTFHTEEDMPGFALATYASETVALRKAALDHFRLDKAVRQELKEVGLPDCLEHINIKAHIHERVSPGLKLVVATFNLLSCCSNSF